MQNFGSVRGGKEKFGRLIRRFSAVHVLLLGFLYYMYRELRHRTFIEDFLCDPGLKVTCCRKAYSSNSYRQAASGLRVIAEVNFEFASPRMEEILEAFRLSLNSNPTMQYIFAVRDLSTIKKMQGSLTFAHEVWHCTDVLYGTLYDIGNNYPGIKIASSADDWFPPVNFNCSFLTEDKSNGIAYLLSREENTQYSHTTIPCEQYAYGGSWDGVMFDVIPPHLLLKMRFPRTYWGCENLGAWVLKEAGYQMYNLCPQYAPIHVHKEATRSDPRVRVNEGSNSLERAPPVTSSCTFL